MSHLITITQQKGGVGKTTLTVNLAVYLSSLGMNVLMIDSDPQQSLSMWYQVRRKNITEDRLTLVTANITDPIEKQIQKYRQESYDLILLDTPPHSCQKAQEMIALSDFVLIPSQLSPPDIWACEPILKMVKQANIPHLLILNRVPPTGKVSQDLHKSLLDNNLPVAVATVGNRNSFVVSFLYGMGVTEVSKKATASFEIIRLCEEILHHVGSDSQSLSA